MPKTYTPIARTTLSSAAATVTFSNISQAYTDLILVCNIAQASSTNSLRARFNSDSGTNYSYTSLKGNGSTASSVRESNISSALLTETVGSTNLELISTIQIQNYSNTTTYKTHIGRGNRASNGTDATVGLWRSTASITSIAIAMGGGFPTDNFATGSTFTLYGITCA